MQDSGSKTCPAEENIRQKYMTKVLSIGDFAGFKQRSISGKIVKKWIKLKFNRHGPWLSGKEHNMEIRVRRATGFLGFASSVALKVDNQLVRKMKNNEEYVLNTDEQNVRIRVNQLYFGSHEKLVNADEIIVIKTNPVARILTIVFMALIVYGSFTHQPAFSILAFPVILVTLVFAIKNWFVLESQ